MTTDLKDLALPVLDRLLLLEQMAVPEAKVTKRWVDFSLTPPFWSHRWGGVSTDEQLSTLTTYPLRIVARLTVAYHGVVTVEDDDGDTPQDKAWVWALDAQQVFQAHKDFSAVQVVTIDDVEVEQRLGPLPGIVASEVRIVCPAGLEFRPHVRADTYYLSFDWELTVPLRARR
ncbi:MAG TPA: hypothetical protein PKD09_17940 [Aggregatilinea sp.]|uniref:hypothetical protein n=1 Tax=Aggregatilinea sp. TaxID=2806333 RepID=UPI002C0CAEFE|nr:hypothetical protein [Aggregatilinea sp.]HML23543.1 hypothetical protein [Aggregatilinea sp.]